MTDTVRIIGIDPGLRQTGWGVISCLGTRLSFVASGTIKIGTDGELGERLVRLADALGEVILAYSPDEAAVEETFVNNNPASTLKLGQARGIALYVPARAGLQVGEYPPNLIKKSVVGAGHADKRQIRTMVKVLLPKATFDGDDSADALAIAICHAHHRAISRRLDRAV